MLEKYGFRVQKSAFEALMNAKQYEKLLKDIEKNVLKDEDVRVYKISSTGDMECFGCAVSRAQQEVIVI